ncbi:hypothetical protein [Niallia taxi]|uniref:hypothetical protein n=1 Tax=Niallia taxi TaxID=2499688 RepID=UPI003D29F8D9
MERKSKCTDWSFLEGCKQIIQLKSGILRGVQVSYTYLHCSHSFPSQEKST